MKTLRNSITTLACLSTVATCAVQSQEAPPILPPSPGAETLTLERLPAPGAASHATLRLVQAPVAREAISIAQATPGAPVAWTTQNDGFLVDFLGTHRPRTLVVRASEADAKEASALEEDISIMSRILAKALNEKGSEDDAMTAMGMKLKALTISGQSTMQNLYLDGYGALFLLSVRFPLVAPPEAAKEEVRKAPANSAWEETRRELYGQKEPAAGMKLLLGNEVSRESYDAKKVARLKESLIEALSNASNIRDLKADEFVTLVVTGSDNAAVGKATRVVEARGEGSGQVFSYSTGGRSLAWSKASRPTGGDTTMTIRAKKSDIDAFAKGDLKLADFQKRVSSATY